MSPAIPYPARYPGEGDTQFAAFSRYLDAGWNTRGPVPVRVPRNARKALATMFGRNAVDMWCEAFEWDRRAAMYDAAILEATADATSAALRVARVHVATVAAVGAQTILEEWTRSLESMRSRGGHIPLTDLIKATTELTKVLVALTPRTESSGAASPNFGNSPDDDLIASMAGDPEPQRGAPVAPSAAPSAPDGCMYPAPPPPPPPPPREVYIDSTGEVVS